MINDKPTYEELENQIAELNKQNELIRLNSAFQNTEKEKRADELSIANKELVFQNEEKEKRAEELIIANKELAFQNKVREKRAAELDIAYEELAFQNKVKEKRAAELSNANKELAFQNKEKEKRAAELIIANKELKQLLQLNSDKDLFISILAHDLRSPFVSILGFLNLLVENIRTYDINEIEEHINIVSHAAKNTFNLLEDLIIWTQSQSGKLPYEPQKLNFSDICADAVEVLKLTANEKNITINQFVAEVIIVYADINMLKTVLRNLVSNAIKFTNLGGRIDIYAEKTQSNIIISVSDEGIGIAPEILNKLFDITQIHSTIGTADEKGTGLGLLLCKEFVEKHDGKIWVESELGKGSKFKLSLPLYKN